MIHFDYDKTYRRCKITGDPDIIKRISYNFSTPNEAVKFSRSKSYKTPSRIYLINPSGFFDIGMLSRIEDYIKEYNISIPTFSDNLINHRSCSYVSCNVFDGLKHKLRDYQRESVSKSLQRGCGVNLLATAAGKSIIQASLIESIFNNDPNMKCLLVVPGISLVSQLVQDFKDYGVSFTFSPWSGSDKLKDTNVIITNSENLNAKFSANRWITDVSLLVVDECHKVNSSSSLYKTLSKITTPHKFGFTATLPPNTIDEWKVIGTFGDVIYKKTSKSLRDEGYISEVNVNIVKFKHPKKLKFEYKEELEYLNNHEGRIDVIKQLINRTKKNTLILVNSIYHGEFLLERLGGIGKNVVFVSGSVDVESRDEIKRIMELNDDVVCVAMASIFSTGISIKNLHYIVFLSIGKGMIRILQSIGRGLRLHDKKNKLQVFDVCDNLKYSERHLEERKQIYASEDNDIPFKETIIKL